MGRDPVEAVLVRLEGVKPVSGGWVARCPAPGHGKGNGDRNPSLSVSRGDDGRALLKCHAGCATEDILPAINFVPADLFVSSNGHNGTNGTTPKARIVAEYDYVDEQGKLLFQAVRMEPKDFRQRRPDGNGGWIWNIGNTRRVLFRLPKLLASDPAQPVFVVEGEKDVLTLDAFGLIATTNAGGAKAPWKLEYSESLRDRHVYLISDNDEAGRDHMETAAAAINGIAATVQILILPDVPEAGDVSDWVASGGTKEAFLRLVADAREWLSSRTSRAIPSRERPGVTVNGRPMDEVTHEAISALYKANEPPKLFVRSGSICRIRTDEKARPIIETAGDHEIRGAMARSANFFKVTETGKTHVAPPMNTVHDAIALGSWDFPTLEAVIETPVIREDGSILSKPGFDTATGLYLTPSPNLKMPPVPEHPDDLDVTSALEIINEMIVDFPFVDSSSKANAIGLMLTSVVRPAIRGGVPLALVDAPRAGTGKTLLVESICVMSTGRDAALIPAPLKEEDWRKTLTSLLSEGATFIPFDEVAYTLSSRSLSAALTMMVWRDRILGSSQTVSMPQRATWMATGNNIRLGGDMPRRCYPIRMDTETSRPWQDREFRHENLLGWVRENRSELLAALLTLVRSYYSAGCPRYRGPKPGKFEAWYNLVGGVLQHVGVKGFLENLTGLYDQMDESAGQWEGFLRAIHTVSKGQTRTVSQLILELERENFPELEGKTLRVWLPDELAEAYARSDEKKGSASFSRKLGKALSAHKDVRYGDDNIHLERIGDDKNKGVATWRVSLDTGLTGLSSNPKENSKEEF